MESRTEARDRSVVLLSIPDTREIRCSSAIPVWQTGNFRYRSLALMPVALLAFPVRFVSFLSRREEKSRAANGDGGDDARRRRRPAERAEMLNSAHWTVASYAPARPLL